MFSEGVPGNPSLYVLLGHAESKVTAPEAAPEGKLHFTCQALKRLISDKMLITTWEELGVRF